ncbi:substrate-binding periplasmic protein [Alysiella filiformis]|uniref:Extracellular solute-binding protein, family 3 n=1 Tax=Alysiella filiformis DSM 16848 TaxID=1120981 RepID=A0A286E987_9NEIS|nr:ABC transporter substrate-binding protein [Alysiella filiformis]QMT31440.1 amino acid ABC transporter substrate-binding protein [Alysiella filiformis]UBQ55549.1 ABC transporter substrate-binding protein [Alysiella filiformis DSM 16848]SOD67466.1 extracellular solute-binding protein, family 3 [Alysiella filiformis DSM 16848]
MLFKIPTIALSVVLGLGLSACGKEKEVAPAAASAPAEQTVAEYRIRTTNQPYPPFNIYNPDNTISGLEADVLAAIAKDQNIKITHVPYVWDVMFTDLKGGNADMVGGGLVKSDYNTEEIVASIPYMRAPDCVVASKPSNLDNWHKRKVALREEDDEEEDLMQNFGVARDNIVYVRSQYQGLQQLLAGTIPTMMSDCSVIRYYIRQSFIDKKDQFHLKELPRTESDVDANENIIFGVRKDQTELLQKINQGITNLKANGELERILQRWQ